MMKLAEGLVFTALLATSQVGMASVEIAPHWSPDPAESRQINHLVEDVCAKDVVMLGEDANHGGGRTLEVKTEILRRLVTNCGFGAVVFESQLYDLLDHEQAAAAAASTRDQLANAIGGLWSYAKQSDGLITFLHEQTRKGRLRVLGMDPQVGGATGLYSQQRLGRTLASVLAGPHREECEAQITRHNSWAYDTVHPFDGAAKQHLKDCVAEIRHRVTRAGHTPELQAMVNAYGHYVAMALDSDGSAREQGMHEALEWHRTRLPARTKMVVWSSTVHAARSLADVRKEGAVPLGGRLAVDLGDDLAVIGFSALSGQFGNPGATGTPNNLEPAAPGTLEHRVSRGATAGLVYVDRGALQSMGLVGARALNYRRTHVTDWSGILDGLVVLREEVPVERRPAPSGQR